MKQLFLVIAALVCLSAAAQKKVVPVSQSALTGISLPVNSKKDGRLLIVFAAKVLLDMECHKNGLTTGSTEVLMLPNLAANGFNEDSLKFQFNNQGWSISPLQSDPKYMLLQKDGHNMIAYFSTDKKETNLYIAETTAYQAPQQNPVSTDQSQNTNIQEQYPAAQNQNNNTSSPQPAVQNDPVPQSNPDPAINQNTITAQPAPVSAIQSANNGILISTINFDDGWTAVTKDDWVQVNKNDITAFLHYAIPLPDELKTADEDAVLNYCRNKLIDPRFNCTNIQKKPADQTAAAKVYFMEADATGNVAGNAVHIAFGIFITNGVAICIELEASSKNSYDAAFPDLEQFKNLLSYNKFQVSAGDITGQWKESAGGFSGFYNAYSASTNNAPSVNQLKLDEQGHFLLEIRGNGENPQSFGETYTGTYTLTNRELVTTDQNNKSSSYTVFYMAVKNGRILYLQNKENTAQEYFMVKVQ